MVDGDAGCGCVAAWPVPRMWGSGLSSWRRPRDHRARHAGKAVLGAAPAGTSAPDDRVARPALPLPVRRHHHRGSARDDSRSAVYVVRDWVGAGPVRCAEGVLGRGTTTDMSLENHRLGRGRRMGHVATLDPRDPGGLDLSRAARFTPGFHRATSGRARGAGSRVAGATITCRGVDVDAGFPRSRASHVMTIDEFLALGNRPPGKIPAGESLPEAWVYPRRTPRSQKGTP